MADALNRSDLVGRLRVREARWVPANGSRQDHPEPDWQVNVEELGGLMDALVSALIDQDVGSSLAELAQIDALAVPQPRVLQMVTRRPVPQTLDTAGSPRFRRQATEVPWAGPA
ncbi:hypothetical protein [Actinomadura decatromicini]|uniref:hypothetical protein n=1 Tax=Actinomadura decatromicini TaxID=2604572 RepID=UPI001652F314|nr:hypothetical protein [Actinomadura decatromicini]